MNFSFKPVLVGARATLRPFTEADADPMWRIVQDPEVVRFTFEPNTSLTPELLRDWYASRAEQKERLDLAVVDTATGQLVGEVVLYDVDDRARSCTFRTLIGQEGRGRGVGTEATRLLLRYAFEQLGMHRVELQVYAFNDRARHVYEKVGFVVEGVRREAHWRDGEWLDEVVMSVLVSDWTALAGGG